MGMLDGKVVAVTGAGNGLGRAYSAALAAAGAAVVCSDVDGTAAERVAREVRAVGGRAVGRGDDVGQWGTGEALAAGAVTEFGKLDVLVNNAGVLRDRMMWNLTESDLDDVYRVHLKGTFACTVALVRHLREREAGGAVINVISAAHQGHPGQSNYAAMKGAIASATYTWAIELARYGIRVNAISPMAWTAMTQTTAKDEAAAKVIAERLGPPERVAPTVVFLASDEAAYVTGQILGACNERISLLIHPREARHAFCLGGWTAEEIARRFRGGTGQVLEPCGSQPQYPWYDGVHPEPRPQPASAD
ncbi:MAG: SDR family oxidoreductase [Chloroflexi bacterium]|nr:MAG: SDR family oxidoreductase [Chloroflexota bacterium]